jgi:hypothetical protein
MLKRANSLRVLAKSAAAGLASCVFAGKFVNSITRLAAPPPHACSYSAIFRKMGLELDDKVWCMAAKLQVKDAGVTVGLAVLEILIVLDVFCEFEFAADFLCDLPE